jgi:ABC-type transport system involved in multi-copper enzyme maturation permease subunit
VVRKSQGVRRAIGEAVYYLVPNLERFNFKYQATYDLTVGSSTLLAVVLFGLAYASAALVAAVVVFQRRDFR